MSIKLTAKNLGCLRGLPWGDDYTVIGKEKITHTVKAPLPLYTSCIDGYLSAYKDYYNVTEPTWCSPYGHLREEYRKNRPTYEVEVSYDVLEIELTPHGKEVARERYEMHKRNMERYAKLLEG